MIAFDDVVAGHVDHTSRMVTNAHAIAIAEMDVAAWDGLALRTGYAGPVAPRRRNYAPIFAALGVSKEDSAEAADVLTMTDLRGVETHGVSNMLRAYVRDYKAGKLNPQPGWRLEREAPATAVIDAGKRALDEGWTHYGPTQGQPELREAIAAHISRTRGIQVGPQHVSVVPGGKPIFSIGLPMTLLDFASPWAIASMASAAPRRSLRTFLRRSSRSATMRA